MVRRARLPHRAGPDGQRLGRTVRKPTAERFIKTLLAEWAYGRLYRTNDERIDTLPAWVTYYNVERTHTALGGITPMEALVNILHGNHT
jgi:transposase InsO family protein